MPQMRGISVPLPFFGISVCVTGFYGNQTSSSTGRYDQCPLTGLFDEVGVKSAGKPRRWGRGGWLSEGSCQGDHAKGVTFFLAMKFAGAAYGRIGHLPGVPGQRYAAHHLPYPFAAVYRVAVLERVAVKGEVVGHVVAFYAGEQVPAEAVRLGEGLTHAGIGCHAREARAFVAPAHAVAPVGVSIEIAQRGAYAGAVGKGLARKR